MGLLVCLVPTAAHANMVWPALYLQTRLATIPVVALSLIIEVLTLRFGFRLSWPRSAAAALGANAISAALGAFLVPLAGIAWEVFPGLLLYRAGIASTFSPLTWAVTPVLALLVTTAVEVTCLRRLFHLDWTRTRWLQWTAANAVTVGIAFGSLWVLSGAWETYRPWLVA
ncbi:hypothetical protein [Phenylobacterium sp.]|uniref:hypothetical protein n=1 Tax=Phenylobacterium sp. TaxID=1871053 RepID=UPI002F94E95D